MKAIREYVLYEGPTEPYEELQIPTETELPLPRNSRVLSVITERAAKLVSIKAYVASFSAKDDEDTITKMIALVSDVVPAGSGWCFINSLVVSTGPESNPTNIPYHAYIKIC